MTEIDVSSNYILVESDQAGSSPLAAMAGSGGVFQAPNDTTNATLYFRIFPTTDVPLIMSVSFTANYEGMVTLTVVNSSTNSQQYVSSLLIILFDKRYFII